MSRKASISGLLLLGLVFATAVGCTPSHPASPAAPSRAAAVQAGSLKLVEIPAPALSNAVFPGADLQQIAVYLPPSYGASTQSYPVVYFLTMFGASLASPRGYAPIQTGMDQLLAAGKIREMIAVTVCGLNPWGGSFYANSPVTGNWEDFVVRDVVGYVDAHYRTRAQAASRGLAGLSMGGNAALALGMRHPDVFGAVYVLSPSLFDPQGLADSQMFASEEVIRHVAAVIDEVNRLPAGERENAFNKLYAGLGNWEKFTFAYGAAFAPAPDRMPPYIRYPYRAVDGNLVRDEATWRQWEVGFGGVTEKIAAYRSGSTQLKAIGLEYGQQDENPWLPRGVEFFSQQLKTAGVAHTLQPFQGGHSDHLAERVAGFMLPFFDRNLVVE